MFDTETIARVIGDVLNSENDDILTKNVVAAAREVGEEIEVDSLLRGLTVAIVEHHNEHCDEQHDQMQFMAFMHGLAVQTMFAAAVASGYLAAHRELTASWDAPTDLSGLEGGEA